MFYEVVDTLCNWHITFSGFHGSSKKAFVHKLLFLQSTFSSDNVIRAVSPTCWYENCMIYTQKQC